MLEKHENIGGGGKFIFPFSVHSVSQELEAPKVTFIHVHGRQMKTITDSKVFSGENGW